MEAAIKQADYRNGDEVLLRTGWGTRERAYQLGIDYYKRTPSIHFDAAALLAKKMDEMGSGLFMTDCGLVRSAQSAGQQLVSRRDPVGAASQAVALGRSPGTSDRFRRA